MALPDKQTYSGVGGEIVDYQAAEDPTTDIPAAADDENRADCSAMTRMIGRAYVTFTTDGATCTLVEHDSVWGNGISVAPAFLRTGAGHYLITWPASVNDARGIAHALNLRRGVGNVELGGWGASVVPSSPNSVFVVTGSMAAGGIAETTGTNITAYVW